MKRLCREERIPDSCRRGGPGASRDSDQKEVAFVCLHDQFVGDQIKMHPFKSLRLNCFNLYK